jgi:hypothetical protein
MLGHAVGFATSAGCQLRFLNISGTTTKSTFSATEKVGQALVDEVIAKATVKRLSGTRTVYWADLKRIVGKSYDPFSFSSNKRVDTQWVKIVVESSNCSSSWRANEVVTMHPDLEPSP